MAAAHRLHSLLSRQALWPILPMPWTLSGTPQQEQHHNRGQAMGCLKQKLRPARRRRRAEQALTHSRTGVALQTTSYGCCMVLTCTADAAVNADAADMCN